MDLQSCYQEQVPGFICSLSFPWDDDDDDEDDDDDGDDDDDDGDNDDDDGADFLSRS